MKSSHQSAKLIAILFCFATSILPAFAGDFGDASDVKQVRKVVAGKFGKPLHASVSHDWALCTATSGESDLSIVLHRTGAGWTVVANDGGAYVAETLRPFHIPSADIAPLLKAYQ